MTTQDLRIVEIDPARPTAKTELTVGDVVTSIDGVDVGVLASETVYALLEPPPGTALHPGLARGVTVIAAPPVIFSSVRCPATCSADRSARTRCGARARRRADEVARQSLPRRSRVRRQRSPISTLKPSRCGASATRIDPHASNNSTIALARSVD